MKHKRSKNEVAKWQLMTAFKIVELERQRGTEKIVHALRRKLDESFSRSYKHY